MKSHPAIIVITAVVLAFTIMQIVALHKASENEIINRFHAHELMAVRQLAREIELYLGARSRGTEFLSSFASLQHRDMREMAANIQEYFRYLKKDHVKAISVYDEKGTIIYSTTQDAIGRSYAERDFFRWATKKENKGKSFISSLIRATDNQTERVPYFRFLIAVPVYQEVVAPRYPKPSHSFVGVLTATIDLEEVISAFLPFVGLSTTKEHVWIADRNGTVLFQSEHPEMVLRNIHRQDETCMQCHISFDHLKRMLGEKQGTVEYALQERPKKTAAFASIEFENISWIVVVNLPLYEAFGFLDRQLMNILSLVGVITVALVGASALIYRINRLRIRAQEEAKQWAEKHALEDRIRGSEARYQRLVEVSPDAIAVHCEGKIVFVNPAAVRLLGATSPSELVGKPALEFVHPDDREMVKRRIAKVLEGGQPAPLVEERFLHMDGSIINVEVAAVPTTYQNKPAVQAVVRDITERKRAKEAAQRIEWMLTPKKQDGDESKKAKVTPTYGDLINLNSARLILDSAGEDALSDIARYYIDLLGTSVAIYEKNGDYALGIFSSGWCRFLDFASRALCQTEDNGEALHSGNWLCHESCWTSASKVAIETGQPADVECNGGIHLYAIPIWAGRQVVGSINVGYGDPPRELEEVQRLAEKYAVDAGELMERAKSYESRPPFIIELAKERLQGSARLIGTMIERKQAEEALRQAEEKYRSIFENAVEGIFQTTLDGHYVTANPALARIYGDESPEELMERVTELEHQLYVEPDRRHEFIRLVEEQGTVANFESRVYCKDGSVIWISENARAVRDVDGKLVGFEGTTVDITERKLAEQASKRAEEALRQSEEKYRTLFEETKDVVYFSTPEGRLLDINPAGVELFGYSSEEELLQIEISRDLYLNPADRTVFQQKLAEQGFVKNYEVVLKRKDAQLITGVETTSVIRDDQGKIVAYRGILRDITDRKRAEETLHESEERYRRFFQEDLTADYISTRDGRLLECNPAYVRTFAFGSHEEALATNVVELYPSPEEREEFLLLLQMNRGVEYHEMELRRRDGAPVYVIANVIGLFDEKGNLTSIRGYMFDDTRRKLLERQFLQAQKMESLGTLAGGIAHDFNNILGIIMGHASLLERLPADPEVLKKKIEAITKAGMRGAALVKQLLTFARKTEVAFESVLLDDVVDEVSKLLTETFPKTITISLRLQKDLPPIVASAIQLHHVLLNLCVNARDAMADSGTLALTTRRVSGEVLGTRFPQATERDYAQLSVADTGHGMDKATRSRIFEPFFTTKERGKGTGLGLSLVYGIIESHNGFIDVESTLGQGTTFHLYFPLLQRRVQPEQVKVQFTEEVPGGSETILVVEDEEMLRELLKTNLEAKGYRVLAASDGGKAVEVYSRHQREIRLVLSDMGLPKLSGHEVYQKLKMLNPSVRMILASGYLEPEKKSQILREGVIDFIQKPYSSDEVLRAIRSVLDMA